VVKEVVGCEEVIKSPCCYERKTILISVAVVEFVVLNFYQDEARLNAAVAE
jgi:hypothetical protein